MRVFNVPASSPFLSTVIAALAEGVLVDGFNARTDPQRLANATIYLPTQRAARMARGVFLDVLNVQAAVLPRLVVLNDIDEDEVAFAEAASPMPGSEAALDLPAALGGMERRLLLAKLVAAWASRLPLRAGEAPLVAGGPAQILALADDLARLMDDMATRGVDWTNLESLVPSEYDEYWQLTLQFIDIARQYWPEVLTRLGKIESADRRDRLIAAEAERLKTHTAGPVIAAGSTGSMPATARFLKAIAELPNGAVVLPGLDIHLEDDAWRMIGGDDGADVAPASSHPQFALHALLARFRILRQDVIPLGISPPHGRDVLISEAMRPSEATAQWHRRLAEPDIARHISQGLQSLAIAEAPNSEMEALAIAVAMREAVAESRSAALVTPDRALARRVMAALDRWNLAFDDSGGDSLMDTSAGLFARLVAEAASEQLAPPVLLALLKHPLFRLGKTAGSWRRAIETLEIALLRGPRPAAGSTGLAHDFRIFRDELTKLKQGKQSLIHGSEAGARIAEADLDTAQTLIAALHDALKPLEAISQNRLHDFAALVACHRSVIDACSRDADGSIAAYQGTDGEALESALADFSEAAGEAAADALTTSLGDYPNLFQTAFADRIVRQRLRPDAPLRIYGPLEARLTQSDRVILGGLVENVWPPAPRNDPWLSRPMRQQLGLDLPERRIGLAAHDFAQLLGSPDVILTHAAKVGGSPAVASRFLHRLEAVAGAERWQAAKDAGLKYLQYAEALDRPVQPPQPCPQPQPRPPRAARPMRMSVTEIEDWLRDPYTIYAKRILRLQPLDPVDMPPSAADRGSAIHQVLGEFGIQYPAALPDNVEQVLRDIGHIHFAPLMDRPEARALWWPRFLRITGWFANWERDRRLNVAAIDAETRGEIQIAAGERTFTLSGRADRIERRHDGTFAIFDYKTGKPPTDLQVRAGVSPQLTLEAAILRHGGFPGIAAGSSVSELAYVRLSGNNPPGEHQDLPLKRDRSDAGISPDDGADEAYRHLRTLIARFDDETQAYVSLSMPMWANRYGPYDDLARIREWAIIGEDEE